jgi:hypothetical protein
MGYMQSPRRWPRAFLDFDLGDNPFVCHNLVAIIVGNPFVNNCGAEGLTVNPSSPL